MDLLQTSLVRGPVSSFLGVKFWEEAQLLCKAVGQPCGTGHSAEDLESLAGNWVNGDDEHCREDECWLSACLSPPCPNASEGRGRFQSQSFPVVCFSAFALWAATQPHLHVFFMTLPEWVADIKAILILEGLLGRIKSVIPLASASVLDSFWPLPGSFAHVIFH